MRDPVDTPGPDVNARQPDEIVDDDDVVLTEQPAEADGAPAIIEAHGWVLGVHPAELGDVEPPRGFEDLSQPAYRGLVSMGDPLKSGTNFTTVASFAYGDDWSLIEGWSDNDLVSAGGNSAVLQRLESGERPIGVILLENLLPRIEQGAPLRVVYPDDGAVPIPSPIAILSSTSGPALAKEVYDAMFSDEVQAAIVAGHMYSPLPGRPAPEGARPWADLVLAPWDAGFVGWVSERRSEIKQRFREIVRR